MVLHRYNDISINFMACRFFVLKIFLEFGSQSEMRKIINFSEKFLSTQRKKRIGCWKLEIRGPQRCRATQFTGTYNW